MTLKEALAKILKKKEPEVMDDNETRDKYLRSLRRERRMQKEEVEKKLLIKKIEEFKKRKLRENLYGLEAKNSILRNNSAIIKKKAQNQAKWFSK